MVGIWGKGGILQCLLAEFLFGWRGAPFGAEIAKPAGFCHIRVGVIRIRERCMCCAGVLGLGLCLEAGPWGLFLGILWLCFLIVISFGRKCCHGHGGSLWFRWRWRYGCCRGRGVRSLADLLKGDICKMAGWWLCDGCQLIFRSAELVSGFLQFTAVDGVL
jgi:hypothetical protein